jgi:uncharacterized protein
MTEPRTYPSGVPCWIDVDAPDPDAAQAFYGGLFGWTFENAMPPGAPGFYLIARLDGADVGALGMAEGDTVAWNTYIAVDDADAAAAQLVAAGATVVAEPWDAGPGGRAAVLTDPGGATFRLWQARRRLGAQVANVPGAWNFSDLHAADPVAAAAFYNAAFSWEADLLPGGGAMWRRPGYGDHLAATSDPGIHERQAAVGAPPGFADGIAWLAPLTDGEEPHWHVSFSVADRDEALATALALGATDVSGPVDTMWTKAVVVRDPQGAVLTLSQFTPPHGTPRG